MLTVGNIDHMLSCTTARLDQLMGPRDVPDRVFHYLPFCFAGSWILLLSCLSRDSVLTLSMDLTKLAEEIGVAAPNYFLNVPTLLERIRTGVEDNIRKRGGMIAKIFDRAKAAWFRLDAKTPHPWDFFWLGLAGLLIFPSDPQTPRPESSRADLRLRAAGARNAAVFHDARDSRAPGLWTHRDHGASARWTTRGTSNRDASAPPFPASR